MPTTRAPLSRSPRNEDVLYVVVEGIELGSAHELYLVLREEPERSPIGGEVEVERVMGGRDDTQGRVDRPRRRVVLLGVEEPRLAPENVFGFSNSARDRARITARVLERQVAELLFVRQLGLRVERGDRLFDSVREGSERTRLEQPVEGLDVRVDWKHAHASGAQKAREHGDGEIRRRGSHVGG